MPNKNTVFKGEKPDFQVPISLFMVDKQSLSHTVFRFTRVVTSL